MTRNFDLLRSILLQVEASPATGQPVQSLECDDSISQATLGEHIDLLIEAGLVDGEVIAYDPVCFFIRRLTGKGHDFLEHARNDTIWKKVRAEAKTKGISVTLHILDGLLTKAADKYAGLGD